MPPCTVRVFKVSDRLISLRDWLLTLTQPNKRQNLLAAAKISEACHRLAGTSVLMTAELKSMSVRRRAAAPQNAGVAMIDDLFGAEPGWADAVARAEVDCDVAQAIVALRARHGLTQQALAARARTTQSVVARLEDAEYTGHSLRMLVRIAVAVGERVEVSFVADAASGRRDTAQCVTHTARTNSAKPRRKALRP